MKAKLYNDSYGELKPEHYKMSRADMEKATFQPAGTVIDHPDAWMLVRMGAAEPADDECKAKASLSDDQLAHAKAQYLKLSKGMSTGNRRYDAPEVKAGADDAQ